MNIDEPERKETYDRILRGSRWLTEPQSEPERFRQWENERRIFGVDHDGTRYYAAYQFDEEGVPLPIIKEILEILSEKGEWFIAAWFYFPNSWLVDDRGPASPTNTLNKALEVLLAARRSSGTYVA